MRANTSSVEYRIIHKSCPPVLIKLMLQIEHRFTLLSAILVGLNVETREETQDTDFL